MLFFPNAKINLGLNVVGRRSDGFHDIETIIYPVGLYDILEFVESGNSTCINCTGKNSGITYENNLVLKAYRLLREKYELPELDIHLHKLIPSGAGLGGGSSDAAFMLRYVNVTFSLGLSPDELKEYASHIGSDCPFFIGNIPAFATGRGGHLTKCNISLDEKYLLLVKPDINISTHEAYGMVQPAVPAVSLSILETVPIQEWKNFVFNDFESVIFPLYPLI
ncbi:MAG: 4-(cytidine 5'-diphospho)-2-C-methyl-D-erythritol kinase, partial [Bacteroidia bacterium]|nr:4-(cytidine 5'-diphospho)-2-C-methyl-D-erythritol kinase [Bacteroidia bacterium]